MMRLPAIVAFRGEKLPGTVHEPARIAARTALLLLNPGPVPRAGNSDLSARFGDALARAGVRVFRFDLSGAGDATGESWRTLGDCRAESQRGERPVAEVGAMVDAILARADTDAVIVGGLCAGATIAGRRIMGRPPRCLRLAGRPALRSVRRRGCASRSHAHRTTLRSARRGARYPRRADRSTPRSGRAAAGGVAAIARARALERGPARSAPKAAARASREGAADAPPPRARAGARPDRPDDR